MTIVIDLDQIPQSESDLRLKVVELTDLVKVLIHEARQNHTRTTILEGKIAFLINDMRSNGYNMDSQPVVDVLAMLDEGGGSAVIS